MCRPPPPHHCALHQLSAARSYPGSLGFRTQYVSGLCGSALGPDTADAACADKRAPHYLYIIHTHTHTCAQNSSIAADNIYDVYMWKTTRDAIWSMSFRFRCVCVCVNLVMRLQTYKYVCFWRQHTKNTHILFNSQLSINMFTNKPWMCVKCLKYELYVCSAFMMMTVWHHEGTFIYTTTTTTIAAPLRAELRFI